LLPAASENGGDEMPAHGDEVPREPDAHDPVRRRVLVVDDEDLVRRVIAALLRRGGLDVIEARDGLDALEKVHDLRPDAILTDLNMPRCDGEQLCRALHDDPSTASIPLVLMTGKNADEARMRNVGCVAVWYKPLLPSIADGLRRIIAVHAAH
jgi:chemosensory pili system protein ChpA (sensor histidine kinase/response regulator)